MSFRNACTYLTNLSVLLHLMVIFNHHRRTSHFIYLVFTELHLIGKQFIWNFQTNKSALLNINVGYWCMWNHRTLRSDPKHETIMYFKCSDRLRIALAFQRHRTQLWTNSPCKCAMLGHIITVYRRTQLYISIFKNWLANLYKKNNSITISKQSYTITQTPFR
jgi:hypothetical protein